MEHFYQDEENGNYYLVNYNKRTKKKVTSTGNEIRKYDLNISGLVSKTKRNELAKERKQFIVKAPKAIMYKNKEKLIYKPKMDKFKGYVQFPYINNNNFDSSIDYLTDVKSIQDYYSQTLYSLYPNSLTSFNNLNIEKNVKNDYEYKEIKKSINPYLRKLQKKNNIYVDKNYLENYEKQKVEINLQEINNNKNKLLKNKDLWNEKLLKSIKFPLNNENFDIKKSDRVTNKFKNMKYFNKIIENEKNVIKSKKEKKIKEKTERRNFKGYFNSKIYNNGELYIKDLKMNKLLNPRLYEMK